MGLRETLGEGPGHETAGPLAGSRKGALRAPTLRALGQGLRRDFEVYRRVLAHPRTPRRARWLLGLAVGYALLPFDLIPDFVPVVGHLDDLVVVPALVFLALRSVPPEILAECRAASAASDRRSAAARGGRWGARRRAGLAEHRTGPP